MSGVENYWEAFWRSRTAPGSQNDRAFQDLSGHAVSELLNPGDVVLDVGCGDCANSALYARTAQRVTGMDMVGQALETAGIVNKQLLEQGKLCLTEGRLLEKRDDFQGSFDVVISERVICNLTTVEQQIEALNVIRSYIKPGGRAVICEPWLQGYERIDEIRASFGLPKLKRHWHNLLIDEEIIRSSTGFQIERFYSFGIYTLLSRITYPLSIHPEEPSFDNPMNKTAADVCKKLMWQQQYSVLPSQHALWVLRKK